MASSGHHKTRTRLATSTKLANYLGAGKDFEPSEVPTLRDVLRKGILLQESNMKNFPVKAMLKDLVTSVYQQWTRSDSSFGEPERDCSTVVYSRRALERRLDLCWKTFTKIANKQITKQNQIEIWESKLDKLFDITVCQCPISLCLENDSQCKLGSKAGSHITCSCEKSNKLPTGEDLTWLYYQREKVGSFSKYQIMTADIKATKLHEKKEKRKAEDALRIEKSRAKAAVEIGNLFSKNSEMSDSEEENTLDNIDLNIEIEIVSNVRDVGVGLGGGVVGEVLGDSVHASREETGNDESLDVAEALCENEKASKNFLDISQSASAALRYGVSSTAAAAITSGYLADLIKGGVVSPEISYLAVDKNKMSRAKQKVI